MTDELADDDGVPTTAADAQLELLRRVTEQMTVHRRLDEVLSAITRGLVQNAGAALARIWLYTTDAACAVCRRSAKDQPPLELRALHLCATAGAFDDVAGTYHRLSMGTFLGGRVAESREPQLFNDLPENPKVRGIPWITELGMRGYVGYPLLFDGALEGVLGIFRRGLWTEQEFRVLGIFAAQAAIAIKTASLIEEVESRSERLSLENQYLTEELRERHGQDELIGRSPALAGLLARVEKVALTDTPVLLLGETGTGKELIGRRVHALSQRRDRPLIRVNCGAIPPGLVESELFGHERGAFSGAVERRLGRFELADHGTLLLDEVGELPAEFQVKLLRVLQDGQFERVGSGTPIRTDVRVIAATNRDLEADVAAGRFRADLYYRLSVFPLRVPPLRERLEDLPLLVQHFLAGFEARLKKPLRALAPESMDRLRGYAWPGNVRELRNVLERACVLAQGPVVDIVDPLPGSAPGGAPAPSEAALATLEQVERAHLLRVLERTKGVIQGPAGAARILGLHPNTLRSRMERMGILRSDRLEHR